MFNGSLVIDSDATAAMDCCRDGCAFAGSESAFESEPCKDLQFVEGIHSYLADLAGREHLLQSAELIEIMFGNLKTNVIRENEFEPGVILEEADLVYRKKVNQNGRVKDDAFASGAGQVKCTPLKDNLQGTLSEC